MLSTVAGKAQLQEHGVSGHIVFTARNQRKMNGGPSLAFSCVV